MHPAITVSDIERGVRAFAEHESRDAMYRISRQLVEMHWGCVEHTADALGVLLLTWNQAAYRYGEFDYSRLQDFLLQERDWLDTFRKRRLETLSFDDEQHIEALFESTLSALQTVVGKVSPVGAAKTLHDVAPRFFPAWDNPIAAKYGFRLQGRIRAATKYVGFMKEVRAVLTDIEQEQPLPAIEDRLNLLSQFPKTLLKFIDEYNYAAFTKKWISG